MEIKEKDLNLEKVSTDSESKVSERTELISLQEESVHNILLVATESESRDRLKALLERENNSVELYDNTTELLSYLEGLSQPEEIQLVSMLIVDWSLSDSLLKKLVRHLQQAPFSHIPLIAMTESPCIEINEAMMFLKRTEVLQKPIKTNDMLTILKKFLVTTPLPTTREGIDSEYYNLLESNSLLELAIKNHNNAQEDGTQTFKTVETLN